ncbi:hypothetical protein A6R68_19488 [Neotoma lepida]|uniref:Uncharacterized protein n=1 Tax=Neotoma lepida TaxID=56216 RepID=A0A1A6HHT2_NEOLE|nr:hypothetical protein A6R68_19488 [Neotoma lepida]
MEDEDDEENDEEKDDSEEDAMEITLAKEEKASVKVAPVKAKSVTRRKMKMMRRKRKRKRRKEMKTKNPSFNITEDKVFEDAMEIRLVIEDGTSKGIAHEFNAEKNSEEKEEAGPDG